MPVAHALPKELRILIAVAATALLGGLMIGFTTQQASAAPVSDGPFVNPCVNYWTGQVSHANGECPSGTFALDVSQGDYTLCVSAYTKKISYRYSDECNWSEFSISVGYSSPTEVWGCVNPWTGGVSWIPVQSSPCNGMAMKFDTGYSDCLNVGAPSAYDQLNAAPLC